MNDKTEGPVHLVEDEDTGDRFLVYGTDKGMRLDIRYQGDTLWMTQAQIAELFGKDISTISRHIANIFSEGELDENNSLQKVQTIRRPATVYNLDVVISVGYRASSAQATNFRRWATSILVQFAKKGFVVDSVRLKDADNVDRVRELREIIRDIRSDEANVYRELKQICTLCQDYVAGSEQAVEFYKHTQAKLIYGAVSQTPAELIQSRADHHADNMGLQSWPNDNIRKGDVTISKNYLAEPEIKELNRLTTILLDIFEDQLDLGRLVTMADARKILDQNLSNLGRGVLRDGGTVLKSDADWHAQRQYEMFKKARKIERQNEADQQISELAKEARKLPKGRR